MRFALAALGLLLGATVGVATLDSHRAAERPASVGRIECSDSRMRVPIKVSAYGAAEATADEACTDVLERIDRLEQMLFDPDGELAMIHDPAVGTQVTVSGNLFGMLRQAEDLSRMTGGAFDTTLRPYIAMWDGARREGRLPSEQEMQTISGRVGWRNVQLDAKARKVLFQAAFMTLDLGAVARSALGEEALDTLAKHGMSSALFEAPGYYAASGAPPGASGWRIPRAGDEGDPMILPPQTARASFAGGGFVSVDGHVYANQIDPRRGRLLSDDVSVTVTAPRGHAADGLATALSVLGPDAGCHAIGGIGGARAAFRRARVQQTDQPGSGSFGRDDVPSRRVTLWEACPDG